MPLARSRSGTRLIQKALDVSSGALRARLVGTLRGHVAELFECAHGNHVLSKLVVAMPPLMITFVLEELRAKGIVAVARHRFGGRVLERLLEFSSEAQVAELAAEILGDCEALCRHPYGNFVVSSLLENGTEAHRAAILEKMLDGLPYLAMHRTASHVVQRLLARATGAQRCVILQRLLRAGSPNSIVEVACSRYGSFVVEELAGVEGGGEVRARLARELPELQKSRFGQAVLGTFNLSGCAPADSAAGPGRRSVQADSDPHAAC